MTLAAFNGRCPHCGHDHGTPQVPSFGWPKDAREAVRQWDSLPPAAPKWQRVTGPGQVKVGTKLRFTLCDEVKHHTAKLILHAGTDKEEVVYNKRQNWYFITSMSIENKGSQKNVEFLAAEPVAQAKFICECAATTPCENCAPPVVQAEQQPTCLGCLYGLEKKGGKHFSAEGIFSGDCKSHPAAEQAAACRYPLCQSEAEQGRVAEEVHAALYGGGEYAHLSADKIAQALREAFRLGDLVHRGDEFTAKNRLARLIDATVQAARRPVRELTDEQIQELWSVACEDTPSAPGWSRHIRFARALLSKATGEGK